MTTMLAKRLRIGVPKTTVKASVPKARQITVGQHKAMKTMDQNKQDLVDRSQFSESRALVFKVWRTDPRAMENFLSTIKAKSGDKPSTNSSFATRELDVLIWNSDERTVQLVPERRHWNHSGAGLVLRQTFPFSVDGIECAFYSPLSAAELTEDLLQREPDPIYVETAEEIQARSESIRREHEAKLDRKWCIDFAKEATELNDAILDANRVWLAAPKSERAHVFDHMAAFLPDIMSFVRRIDRTKSSQVADLFAGLEDLEGEDRWLVGCHTCGLYTDFLGGIAKAGFSMGDDFRIGGRVKCRDALDRLIVDLQAVEQWIQSCSGESKI